MMARLKLTSVLAVALLGTAGCVVETPNPYPAPPAPRVEVVPAPPSQQVVWEPGHYQWNGASYVWIPGRYVARTAAGSGQWVHGHWAYRGGTWVWVPGHWA